MDNQEFVNQGNKFSQYLTRRTIFVVLAIIVVVELVWAAWILSKSPTPITSKTTTSKPVAQKPTEVTLKVDKASLKVGEKVTVSISLFSDKATDGTDLIISFDPKYLTPDQVINPVKVGTVYTSYPTNSLGSQKDRIIVSGITNQTNGVVPQGVFGSIVFTARAPGKTLVNLDFTPGSTADSNVIESKTGKDLLEKVNNLELNIVP